MDYSKTKRSWVRWTTWEYWPMWLSNLPVAGFYLWFAAKARHLLFFSAANPAIQLSGAMGESKYDILQRLPAEILPKMVFAPAGRVFDDVLADLANTGISFPLIAKPDIGERGLLVKKIGSRTELQVYLAQYPVDFILQALITLPLEASVLYVLFPGAQGRFMITSVCTKVFLKVSGDGKSTLRQLVEANPRASFQLERLNTSRAADMGTIPSAGQTVVLGEIGNHCLGTKFLNSNHLINPRLEQSFAHICRQIEGIHYGRFDLKCADEEALQNGQIQVMELNGVLGEPAHVYDPSFGPWRAYRDFLRHWRLIFEVSQSNRKLGVPVTTLKEGRSQIQQYLAYKKRCLDIK